MGKTELTLLEVYEECLGALYEQARSLERLRSSLERLRVPIEANRVDFEPLLERNRAAQRAVNLLLSASANELEQLRFERDQLLKCLARPGLSGDQAPPQESTAEAQADG